MTRWLTLAEMQARDLAHRWIALGLLFALPATWYLAELAAGQPWAIGAGALAMGWTTGAAALFAVLGSRHVDPRLVQAGYRPLDILLGRLAVLLTLALLTATTFAVLIVVGSHPDRLGDLSLGLTLGGLVAVTLGWTIAVLIPHELEAILSSSAWSVSPPPPPEPSATTCPSTHSSASPTWSNPHPPRCRSPCTHSPTSPRPPHLNSLVMDNFVRQEWGVLLRTHEEKRQQCRWTTA